MKSNKFIRPLLIVLLLVFNIGCDQVSKVIVRHQLVWYDRYHLLYHHITLQRVENTGAFLSLGDSLSGPVKMVLLNIFPLIAVLFGVYYLFKKTQLNRASTLAIILIVGGGFGNIYDRIAHGSVTDFIHINFVIFQTGIFNVADTSIMAGTFIILIKALLKKKEEPAIENEAQAE